MTSPITPNPGIHKAPETTVNTPALFTTTQIETWALQLFNTFATSIVNAILASLGLSAFVGPAHGALSALTSGLTNTPTAPLQALMNGLGLSSITQFVSSLTGLLPPVLDLLDGTTTLLGGSQITLNGDGTATLPMILTSPTSLNGLFDSLDGTTMTLTHLLQNFTSSLGRGFTGAQTGAMTDGIVQALAGGSSTGNSIASIKPSLLAIPAGNVVGVIGGTAVVFGATGGGASSATTHFNSASLSWSHTPGASDNYAVVGVAVGTAVEFNNYAFLSQSCTYGGNAMSFLGYALTKNPSGSVIGYLQLFGMANPPAGASTVTYSASESGSQFYAMAGNSLSYSGWASTSSASAVQTVAGANPSQTVSSAANHRVVQLFVGGVAGSTSFSLSSYNQTSRYAVNNVGNGSWGAGGGALAMILGDAPGGSSVAFSATASTFSSETYTAIAVDLFF